jgi:hypothetical protein
MTSKLIRIYREIGSGGLSWRLFHHLYKNFIRLVLPNSDQILYAGIPVGYRKVADQLISRDFNDAPGYEQALVTALRANIKRGDQVVIVGGGLGVTSVVAALAAGETGHVECFEGDLRDIVKIRRVAQLNGVLDRITARHAIVGKTIAVSGNAAEAPTVRPSELPACDVLELDCEGSEIGILGEMTIRPRVISVETHGFLGAPSASVRKLLQSHGYQVQDLGWAEPRFLNTCVQNDIRVLVGTLRSNG